MTHWPNVEERIRGILDVMVEEAGFQPPAGSQLRQSWISGAREYAEVVGIDEKVVRKAIRYMRQKELIIKSPRSLIAVALNMKRTPMFAPCSYCSQIGGHADDCERRDLE